jgi:Tol biopolymer transport system component
MKSLKAGLFALTLTLTPAISHAQYWRAMPPVSAETAQVLSFSQDEKHVIYLSRGESGVPNIYKIPVKGGAAEQVTKYTDGEVLRPISTVGRPTIVFMRPATAGTKDYHLYLVPQAGGEPRDLTPTPAGVSNVIIGSSYTGRFIYYTSNKTSRDKHDIYRYDVWQNIHELVYANDKNYQPVSWTKDQNKVAVRDPESGRMTSYDINTTEILDHNDPADDPATPENSINGKFSIDRKGTYVSVIEKQSKQPLSLNEGANNVGIAPKETLVAYTVRSADGSTKLFVYDVAKKTSTELTAIK